MIHNIASFTRQLSPQKPVSFGYLKGSSQACSRSIKIQYRPMSAARREMEQDRASLEAMQAQYEMATWQMQARILRYREAHSSSSDDDDEEKNDDPHATSTIIGYCDDDDDDDDDSTTTEGQDDLFAHVSEDKEPEIFQMDL
mmetsp:Transcript_5249/g.10695  ORF Transcript_5249/g.10695 Transcript_5249/m.10695 type:complete len:142 (+) Transcript_5249:206-631(+)|eukprot:scaffold6710_cov175-Amphora_coffeaeformis.AAC.5